MAKKVSQADLKALQDKFGEMDFEQQASTLASLTEAHNTAKKARADELLSELRALGIKAPTGRPKGTGGNRASPAAKYRAPNGYEWSGRGALPKVFKELGVTDKAGMAQYEIK